MVIELIESMVSEYDYGQFNLLDGSVSITYNPLVERIKFENYFRHDDETIQTGSCSELMASTYRKLRQEFPDNSVIRVSGNDPLYFNTNTSNHCFLLFGEDDLMEGESSSRSKISIDRVISKNPLVIDPCFNVVEPIIDSGYKIKRMFNQNYNELHSNSLILNNGDGVPLCFASNGALAFAQANFDSPYLIDIAFPNAWGYLIPHRLDSKKITDMLPEDKVLNDFVSFFRDVEKKETLGPLSLNYHVLLI